MLCFVVMRSTKLGCLIVFFMCLECSRWEEVHGLGSITFGIALQKFFGYWNIFPLKIKLNHSWKFRWNWNVPLVLLERSWWIRFNGIYLVRIGFRMWEILILKWFLPLKIQINFQKTRFWKEKSVEDVVTLGANCTCHTSFCDEHVPYYNVII